MSILPPLKIYAENLTCLQYITQGTNHTVGYKIIIYYAENLTGLQYITQGTKYTVAYIIYFSEKVRLGTSC